MGTALAAPATSCASAPGLVGSKNFTVGQCDRLFPYYNNVQDSAGFYGKENYKSFQARVEKRMGINGTLNANYTWSKNMGNTDTQNEFLESKGTQQGGNGSGVIQDWNNLAGEYSLISFDVTNRAIVSYVQNLPFGKGQKFAYGLSGPFESVVSGWALSGIVDFQSGFPVYLIDRNPKSVDKLRCRCDASESGSWLQSRDRRFWARPCEVGRLVQHFLLRIPRRLRFRQ